MLSSNKMSSSSMFTDNNNYSLHNRYSIIGNYGTDQFMAAANQCEKETTDENINYDLLCLIIELMTNKTLNNDEICSSSSKTTPWKKNEFRKLLQSSLLLSFTKQANINKLHHHRQRLSLPLSSPPTKSLSYSTCLSSNTPTQCSPSIVYSQPLLGVSNCSSAPSNNHCPMFFDDQYCFFNCTTENTGKCTIKSDTNTNKKKLITEAN